MKYKKNMIITYKKLPYKILDVSKGKKHITIEDMFHTWSKFTVAVRSKHLHLATKKELAVVILSKLTGE